MREVLPDLSQLSASDKDALIVELWTRRQAALASVAELTAQVRELQERMGKPPKTPGNSLLPRSKGEKANKKRRRRKKRKGRACRGARPGNGCTSARERCCTWWRRAGRSGSRRRCWTGRGRRCGWRTCSGRSKGTGSAGRCAWRTSCGTSSTRSTRGTRCSRRRCWHGCSRAIKVGQKRERVKDVTLQRHRRDLRKRLEAILQLEPEQADGQRLRQHYAKCKEGLLVFVTDREVPFTNNESERALRPSVIFRKVTNGTRSEWGAEFFAAVRSVIGTGRLNGLWPFNAIAQTIDGRSILNPN